MKGIVGCCLFLVAAVLRSAESRVLATPTVTAVTKPVLHAEGPTWDSERQVLWFVDINGQMVNRYQPSTGAQTNASTDGLVTFLIPIVGSEKLMAGVDRDLVYVTWSGEPGDEDARVEVIASVDQEPGLERNRFNDAKADASGRLWAGTMGYEHLGEVEPQKGSLYSLSPDSDAPLRHLTSLDISNGLIWSGDASVLYFIDSDTHRVDAFDFDLDHGTIDNRRPVFQLSQYNLPGIPDGMTIDADGNLWVALFNGHRVIKVDPRTGDLLDQVELPARDVTSATFGGPDLDVLYVTTSRKDLTPGEAAEQPLAGAVFAVEGLGTRGVPTGNNRVRRDKMMR